MRNEPGSRSGRSLRDGSAFAALLVAAGGILSACSGAKHDATTTTGNPAGGANEEGGARGAGRIAAIHEAANDATFGWPFDATPSPDGKIVYFTAIGADGTGGVFTVAAAGGAVTRIDSGGALVSPVGIAVGPDGAQLYVTDPAAEDESTGGRGAVFSIPSGGGVPSAIAGTRGTSARGVTTAGAKLYFTGIEPTRGAAAVYAMDLARGGVPELLASGAPLVDPGGVAITGGGDVYVADAIGAASKLASVVHIAGGRATTLVEDLGVGYPAGLALVEDESALLVSGLDPVAGTDLVYRIELGTAPKVTSFNQTISAFSEPAGLHRAAGADIYAWADSLANGTGTVYVLTP
ncbi:MAG: hypothetical protein JOZ69_17895 [Myxococcales bacterium]|nr:hypothetical protein [Myxococcales bacterium]